MKVPISLTIFDDSNGEYCSSCGESVELVIEHLREKYGDEVTIEHLDFAEPAICLRYQEIANRVKEGELMLPLVAIDGVLRLSGALGYRTVVEAIETQKEVGRGRALSGDHRGRWPRRA